MKALFAAAAMVLAFSALSPAARAEGPRPSSENNWSGMSDPNAVAAYAYPLYQYQGPAATAPHYEWRESYNPHGKWGSGWVLVQ
jgi:hypothetical protein